jgi:dTDP-4-amino-4,6-dideoxygalactose transaminase
LKKNSPPPPEKSGSEPGWNYAYCPVFVKPGHPLSRDELYTRLKEKGIYPRRYFYPLITEFPMYRDLPSARRRNLPIAFDTASRVLCLPIYPGLDEAAVDAICNFIAGWE